MNERQVGSLTFYLDLSQPLYEQVLQQMRNAIAKGEVQLEEKIPSVREMAHALKINPNTVSHAYQELERDGLTETRRGQGTFITHSQARVDRFRADLAQRAVQEFLQKMNSLGYSMEEIDRCLRAQRQGGTINDRDCRPL